MSSLFEPIVGAPPSTLVVSNTLGGIFPAGADVSIVSGPGTILKNASDAGSSSHINAGDSLAIRVQSSPKSLEAVYTVVKIGDLLHTFSVITRQAAVYVPYVPFAGVSPLDLTAYQDGTAYAPDMSAHSLSEYANDGTYLRSVPVPQTSTTTTSTNDTIVVPNYYSDSISFLDQSTFAVIATVPVGSRPHSIAYTRTSPTDPVSMVWVTLSGENKVALVSMATKQVIAKYPAGTKPTAIAASIDGWHVYIANTDNRGGYTHFRYANGAWTSTNVPIGRPATAIVVDFTGRVWVANTDDGIRIFDTNDTLVNNGADYTGTGYQNRGMIHDVNGNIWVAQSGRNVVRKISVINLTTMAVIPVGNMPTDLTLLANGNIAVTNFQSSTISIVNTTTNTVSKTISTGKYPYGIAADLTGAFWAMNYYQNTPEYYCLEDHTPDAFSFAPRTLLMPNTAYETEKVTITGLLYPTALSIPSIYSAKLVVDGTEYAGPVIVNTGSVVSVRYTTPNYFRRRCDIPVFLGDKYTVISADTRPGVYFPDPVTFDPILYARGPHEKFTTNTVTISGLHGTSITVKPTKPGWQVLLNGILMDADMDVPAVDGDTIAMVGHTDLYNDTLEYDVSIGAVARDLDTNEAFGEDFGTFSVVVQVINNAIEWDEVHHVSDLQSKYVEWDEAFHLSSQSKYVENIQPIRTVPYTKYVEWDQTFHVADSLPASSSVKFAPHTAAQPVATRQPSSLHVTEVMPKYTSIEAASLTVSETTAQYVRALTASNVIATGLAPLLATNKAAGRIVASDSKYVRGTLAPVSARMNVSYTKDRSVGSTVSVGPAYERNEIHTPRQALAEYMKEVVPAQPRAIPVAVRNELHSLRDVQPVYTKTSKLENTAPPEARRNQVFPLRDVEPMYSVLQAAQHEPINAKYVVLQAAQYDAGIIPAMYTVLPSSRRNTVDAAYHVPVRARHLEVTASSQYVVGTHVKTVTYAPSATRPTYSKAMAPMAVPLVNRGTKVLIDQKFVRVERTMQLVKAMQPQKVYVIHNMDYNDTPEMQGTYATASEAIAAGTLAGYANVRATKLPGGTYMWNVPFTCDEPIPTVGIPKPQKWYVNGG